MTETGGNGPAVCQGPKIGSVVSIQLGVEESGSSIHLILDPANYATDETGDYHGSVSGTTIQATGLYYGNDLCVGAVGVPAHSAVPSTFTGSMSADGTTLTGHEVRTLMTAEQTVTYEYDWKAVLK